MWFWKRRAVWKWVGGFLVWRVCAVLASSSFFPSHHLLPFLLSRQKDWCQGYCCDRTQLLADVRISQTFQTSNAIIFQPAFPSLLFWAHFDKLIMYITKCWQSHDQISQKEKHGCTLKIVTPNSGCKWRLGEATTKKKALCLCCLGVTTFGRGLFSTHQCCISLLGKIWIIWRQNFVNVGTRRAPRLLFNCNSLLVQKVEMWKSKSWYNSGFHFGVFSPRDISFPEEGYKKSQEGCHHL